MNRTSRGVLLVLIILLLPVRYGAAQDMFPTDFPVTRPSSPFPGNIFSSPGTSAAPSVPAPPVTQEFPETGMVPDIDRLREVQLLEEAPSAFELYVRNLFEELEEIGQFGYDLFRQPPSTFAPIDYVPISPDYLLGPGDELRVSVWGNINGEFTAVIDTEGKILFPTIGILHISGLTFSEAKDHLKKEFARQYKPSQVKINVSMGRLRSLGVFVVGSARRPGSYTVSSFSTLVNALFASGGPNKQGTMRDIQVNRNGETVVRFDLYDFLMKGDKTKDIRLMPEDVIFIPPIGPLAAVAGDVRKPAIYELKGKSTLEDLIGMAGGLSDIAFTGRVQLIRVEDNHKQAILEYSLTEQSPDEIEILPGDVVRIFPIVENLRRVRLSGAVERAGEFGISAGMTVKDLISRAGGLKHYAFMDEAELFQVTPTSMGPITDKRSINLEKALEGDPQHDIPLTEDDHLLVKAVPEWELYRSVTVTGEVKFPGTYTIQKGERLSSLIERAGLTENAYLLGTVFIRQSVRALQQTQLDEAVDRLEQQLLVRSATTIEAAISPETAEQEEAAARQRQLLVAKIRAARAKGRLTLDLSLLGNLDKFTGSENDIVLEDGDTLHIPETPAEVQVIGSVYNQNAFLHAPEEDVSSYIYMAGGMTKNADKKELYVLKVDGIAISTRHTSGFMKQSLDPGDTIVVPEKLDKIAWLREVKDITQILYQIAVTAGVLIVAF